MYLAHRYVQCVAQDCAIGWRLANVGQFAQVAAHMTARQYAVVNRAPAILASETQGEGT